jgi:hypothetical protein
MELRVNRMTPRSYIRLPEPYSAAPHYSTVQHSTLWLTAVMLLVMHSAIQSVQYGTSLLHKTTDVTQRAIALCWAAQH